MCDIIKFLDYCFSRAGEIEVIDIFSLVNSVRHVNPDPLTIEVLRINID